MCIIFEKLPVTTAHVVYCREGLEMKRHYSMVYFKGTLVVPGIRSHALLSTLARDVLVHIHYSTAWLNLLHTWSDCNSGNRHWQHSFCSLDQNGELHVGSRSRCSFGQHPDECRVTAAATGPARNAACGAMQRGAVASRCLGAGRTRS